jgi:3-dehydroquinate synthase
MEVFPVSEEIMIQSHKGEYTVRFIQGGMDQLNETPIVDAIYIVDSRIADLYKDRLFKVLTSERVLSIDANEQNKSLDKFPGYVDALVNFSIRRGQPIVAIGGGIIQDITCFLATTMMRGLPWVFYPTTLLAQADSCIGSKSSINSGEIKNILGTFTPPDQIIVDVDFLETLEEREMLSGIGEMIKVHAIDSPEAFTHISDDYDQILKEKSVMEKYIHDSLLIKKILIELDEFDQGPRNVMNYGHSFGHAVESATNYGIPHGIAVTIGMDMANFIAAGLGVSDQSHFERMHGVLVKNYASYRDTKIDPKILMAALKKDKKNTSTQLRLILPDMDGKITIGLYDNTPEIEENIIKYLNTMD